MSVYFIRAGVDGPFVKIGTAIDVAARLATIETACPFPVTLMREVAGGRTVERWFHSYFAARRTHREWFSYCDEMLTVSPPALVECNPPDFPIIGKLGGRDAVVRQLKKRGHEIGWDAVRMWAQRGTIPGDAARVLMRIAEEERIRFAAADFELQEEGAEPPARRVRRGARA